MKTPEDEAFDELARKQGAWGGGFPAKRAAAADKLHWSDCAVHNGPAYPAGPCDCGPTQPWQEPHGYDWSMLEAAQESLREHMARIKELEAQLSQPVQERITSKRIAPYSTTLSSLLNSPAHQNAMAQPAQEPVADRLERLLWEYIDLQAAHPEHKPNPKTWPHLMTYAPLPVQPEQEPVAWVDLLKEAQQIVKSKFLWKKFIDGTPLANDIACWMADFAQQYTAPPQRPWVGLTDEEIKGLWTSRVSWTNNNFARAVEQLLKEKNNGT